MSFKRTMIVVLFALLGILLAEGMSRAGIGFGTRVLVYCVVIAVLVALDNYRSMAKEGIS